MLAAENILQLPITEMIGSQEVKFARLDMRDLVAWCAEEKANNKREILQRQSLNPALDPGIKNKELKDADAKRITIWHLTGLVDEPEGIQKVLRKSLIKSGEAKDDPGADAIIEQLHWQTQQLLALAVMSPPKPKEQKKENDPGPLVGKPEGSNEISSGQTGS